MKDRTRKSATSSEELREAAIVLGFLKVVVLVESWCAEWMLRSVSCTGRRKEGGFASVAEWKSAKVKVVVGWRMCRGWSLKCVRLAENESAVADNGQSRIVVWRQ